MVIERWRPRWGINPWRPFRELEEMERLLESPFVGWAIGTISSGFPMLTSSPSLNGQGSNQW